MSLTDAMTRGEYNGEPKHVQDQLRALVNDRILDEATRRKRAVAIVAEAGHHTPSPNGATAQQSVDPPSLAHEQRILDRFRDEVVARGLVGEERNAATLYLVVNSHHLDKQVSAGVKGHSSSGKSWTVETVLDFFPSEDVIEYTAMSERALVYSKRELAHKTIVVYEVVALREGQEDNQTAYFVRSLLSEGKIEYEATVRDKESGGWTTTVITRNGPTNLVFTTTATQVHNENETRVLSLNTDDSSNQTKRVLLELAKESSTGDVPADWLDLQRWLATANHSVTIPYASALASQIKPVAVRLRRDFSSLLALIRSHAMLHQQNRETDDQGRVTATIEDYEVIRDLIADAISSGVESTVPPTVRETVETVKGLGSKTGATVQSVADKLDLDKSNASRRLRRAADNGYIKNLEDKRGKPARWVVGDPMPDDSNLLPQPATLLDPKTALTPQVDEGVARLRPDLAGVVKGHGPKPRRWDEPDVSDIPLDHPDHGLLVARRREAAVLSARTPQAHPER